MLICVIFRNANELSTTSITRMQMMGNIEYDWCQLILFEVDLYRGFPYMNCTRNVILKGIVNIVSCECNAYART